MRAIAFYFGTPLLILFLLFFIWFLIKVLIDKKRGLVDKDKIYHDVDISNCRQDTLISLLDNSKIYHKSLILTKEMMIYMNEYRLCLILSKDYIGNIIVEDGKWILKSDYQDREIKNLYTIFREIENYIKDKLENYEYEKYLVLGSLCYLNEIDKDIKLVRVKNLYFNVNNLKTEKKYTKEEIDNFFSKLKWSEKNGNNN